MSSAVFSFLVFNSVNSNTGEFLATWADSMGNISYAIYDGTSWTTLAQVPLGASNLVGSNVVTSCDPATGQFLATWRDITNTGYYATFNGTTWTTPGTAIPITSSSFILSTIFTSVDPTSGQFLATWSDNTATGYYAVYDVTTSMWSTDTVIPAMAGSIVNDIFTSFDSTTGQFLATWQNAGALPYYAIYNPTMGMWTTGGTPLPESVSAGTEIDVFTSFNPLTGQSLATWGDSNTDVLYSMIFDGTNWLTPDAPIPNNGSGSSNVFSSANSLTGQFLATWGGLNGLPYYAIYGPSVPSVLAPAALTVKANISNEFGVVKEYYNLLKWTPSPSQGVIGYRIFRNDVLIATVGADDFSYKDHNRKKHKFIIYAVASIDANGNQSSPITVNVD
jgi:hypothetical protein